MRRHPPRSTRTDTLFPYTALFRSQRIAGAGRAQAPDANDEWLFYQSLLGAWPTDFDPTDNDACAGLCARLDAFMTKALREAKRHTTWTAPAEGYEAATSRFVRGVFERSELLADMDRSFTPLIPARSEERSGGTEGVRTCRVRGAP